MKESYLKKKSDDSNSIVKDYSEESPVQYKSVKKCYILKGQFSHTTDNCKNLRA